MPLAFLVGFVALVIAEIYVIVLVAHATSAIATVLLLLVTSVAGGALVRREGARAWRRAAQSVEQGKAPGKEVADAALILVGGALLVPPGFITDVVGLLLVLPFTRAVFRGALGAVLIRRVTRRVHVQRGGTTRHPRPRPGPNGNVVEGEVVDRPAKRQIEHPAISDDDRER